LWMPLLRHLLSHNNQQQGHEYQIGDTTCLWRSCRRQAAHLQILAICADKGFAKPLKNEKLPPLSFPKNSKNAIDLVRDQVVGHLGQPCGVPEFWPFWGKEPGGRRFGKYIPSVGYS